MNAPVNHGAAPLQLTILKQHAASRVKLPLRYFAVVAKPGCCWCCWLALQVKKTATKKAASTGKKPAAKTPKTATKKTPKSSAKKATPKPKTTGKKPAKKATPKSAAKKA